MKKVLIIGANSALAKITKKLLHGGYEIITAGRYGCDLEIDITKEFTIPADIDVVINFAAYFGNDIDTAINTNVIGVANICKNAGNVKLLILISSISAVIDKSNPYYTPYAITKKHSEEIAQYYCTKNNIPLLILRPTQLYGDSDDFSKNQPLFYAIKNNALNGKNTIIYGKNDAKRNYISADDIAKIIKLCIDKQVTGLYNCVYEKDTTISEIAKSAYKIFNNGGEVIFDETKQDIPDNVFVYDDTLYKKIGFYPKTTVKEFFEKIKGQA